MKKEILLLSLSALMVVSCKSVENSYCEEDLLGEWHEIMPVNKDITQGFVLDKDGQAVSVGMATLKYSGWQLLKEKDGGSDIVLIGKSIGNGQTIQFSDTLKLYPLIMILLLWVKEICTEYNMSNVRMKANWLVEMILLWVIHIPSF